jgi:hypothetical protein
MSSKKIISIMPVWDEQNIIGLSLMSTKDIVYQYVILLQKGVDRTREVIDFCVKLWDLNVIIVDTEIKLREKRKLAIELTKSYADYYLIQDADEIYYTNSSNENIETNDTGRKTNDTNKIIHLVENDYSFCHTSILFLEKTFLHTSSNKNMVWLTPHPFLFKNTPDIFFPDIGDMPACNPSMPYYKPYTTGPENKPFKMDCKIKNFRRVFLRDIFTQWHDSVFDGTIEEYADKYHHTVIWYRENIDRNLSLDEIIEKHEKYLKENVEEDYKWVIPYDQKLYYNYPEIIQKCIKEGLIKGIDDVDKDINFFLK